MIKNYFSVLCFLFLSTGNAFSQAPVMSAIQGSFNICWSPNSTYAYSVTATNNPLFYFWNIYSNNGTQVNGQGSSSTTIPFPNQSGVYYITCQATNTTGPSNLAALSVTVHELPNVTFSGNTNFCQGSSTNLSASPTIFTNGNPIQYSWSPPIGLNTTLGANVNASPAQTTTYVVSATNAPCPTFTAQVIVNPVQVTFSLLGNTSICQGNNTNVISATPNLSGTSTLSYNWYPSLGLSNVTGQSVTASPSITTVYSVIATDGFCVVTNTIGINVQQINFSLSSNTIICQGYTTTMTAMPDLSQNNGLTYSWSPLFGLNTDVGQMVIANPSVTTVYMVTATDGTCAANKSVTLTVDACVGIKNYELGDNTITVYPNPSSGRFFIKASETGDASLVNELGHTVRQLKFVRSGEIEIRDLDAGIYFLITPRTRVKIVVMR